MHGESSGGLYCLFWAQGSVPFRRTDWIKGRGETSDPSNFKQDEISE